MTFHSAIFSLTLYLTYKSSMSTASGSTCITVWAVPGLDSVRPESSCNKQVKIKLKDLTLLHSEWPKLYGVLAILSATGLRFRYGWVLQIIIYGQSLKTVHFAKYLVATISTDLNWNAHISR